MYTQYMYQRLSRVRWKCVAQIYNRHIELKAWEKLLCF